MRIPTKTVIVSDKVSRMKELKGKVALVTGVGRERGIGTAICLELARQGVDIYYTFWKKYDAKNYPNDDHKPQDLAKELRSMNIRADFLEADLSDLNTPRDLYKAVKDKLGAPSILINNACYDNGIPFTDLSADLLDSHYRINLRATTLMCVEFVQNWKEKRGGRIINITSGQSISAMSTDQIPYTITKAGLEMLAIQLAPGIIDLGITINAVDPGPTDTGWMSDDLKENIKKNSVVNQPVDVAKEVVLLLADRSETITGKVIHVGR